MPSIRRLGVAVAAAACALAPASALGITTTGFADGGLHPNVGAILTGGPGAYAEVCSATLVSPTVLVTASHCTSFLAADPRADFARYAWGKWSEDNPLPADKSRWGSFAQLDQYNQAGLRANLETAAAKSHEPGSVEQKVGDFFASAMDTTAINAAGTKPVATDLAQVAAIKNPTDLAHTLAVLHNQGVSGMFVVAVSADQKKSDINALYAFQGGLGSHILEASRAYHSADLFAGVVVLGIIGLISNISLSFAEARLLRWRRP